MYNMAMARLAFVEIPNAAGDNEGIPAEDIWYIVPRKPSGSIIHFRSARLSLISTNTVAQNVALIEAKWDEWLLAFPA